MRIYGGGTAAPFYAMGLKNGSGLRVCEINSK